MNAKGIPQSTQNYFKVNLWALRSLSFQILVCFCEAYDFLWILDQQTNQSKLRVVRKQYGCQIFGMGSAAGAGAAGCFLSLQESARVRWWFQHASSSFQSKRADDSKAAASPPTVKFKMVFEQLELVDQKSQIVFILAAISRFAPPFLHIYAN